jgi:hypothetical protein
MQSKATLGSLNMEVKTSWFFKIFHWPADLKFEKQRRIYPFTLQLMWLVSNKTNTNEASSLSNARKACTTRKFTFSNFFWLQRILVQIFKQLPRLFWAPCQNVFLSAQNAKLYLQWIQTAVVQQGNCVTSYRGASSLGVSCSIPIERLACPLRILVLFPIRCMPFLVRPGGTNADSKSRFVNAL